MLLTISYTGQQTQDIGYLLHKNPYRSQMFDLSFGKAYVFYPELSDEKTTAALLLDINPIDLARGKSGSKPSGLFDYVNDRPYVSSSFLSTAIVRVFGTAMTGRCDKKPELAKTELNLTACIHMLPCRTEDSLANEIFEPLGYTVDIKRTILDEKFPEWGNSPYIDLTISGKKTLSQLLNHLYVLIPVFDRQKHYYISDDEIDKLLNHGEGWLVTHPSRNKIITRYFSMRKSFAHKVIDFLAESEPVLNTQSDTAESDEVKEKKKSLNTQRLEAVQKAVIESGATSVIDLGCGECKLTGMLLQEQQIKKVTAADVSVSILERAKQRLNYDRMIPYKKSKLTLIQASLTYKDSRFSGYDTACIVEVIEHLDPQRIEAFERVIFEFALPKTVIITTPNKEYNANYGMSEETLRHSDHRFEWNREEFKTWAEHICSKFGYEVEITEIGDKDEQYGSPTQMGVFKKCV